MTAWLGIDVGGERKRHFVAVVDEEHLVHLDGGLTPEAVVELALQHDVVLAGVDAPLSTAPPGGTSRASERELNARICGIRWTPHRDALAENPYYAWVRDGLRLGERLAAAGVSAVEVFPTASWTRWTNGRGSISRAAWSRAGMVKLVAAGGLKDVPARLNQDKRDAIAAAVTARLHSSGQTEAIGGEIVVPVSPLP